MRREREAARIVLSGTVVIAVCYGLGRYAYGLFVPHFQDTLELSSAAVGAIGGMSHVGYALGLVAAPALCRRFGAGRVAAGAGMSAAIGLGAVAASIGPVSLGTAVLAAGAGSGLASPALAQVVVRRFRPADRSPAQTWVNSGTSLGLAVSAPTVLLALHWRHTWGLFALLAAFAATVAWATLAPDESIPTGTPSARRDRRRATPGRRLMVFALVVGATSAPYWTFARRQVLAAGLTEGWSAGFWMVIGVFGLAGGAAGAIADRLGLVTALRLWSVLWALSIGVLALPALPTLVALGSAGLFGAAYMALTGLVILWAVADLANEATAGVRAGFLALGAGQAAATPVAGLVADTWSLPATFAVAAVASLAQIPIASAANGAVRPAEGPPNNSDIIARALRPEPHRAQPTHHDHER